MRVVQKTVVASCRSPLAGRSEEIPNHTFAPCREGSRFGTRCHAMAASLRLHSDSDQLQITWSAHFLATRFPTDRYEKDLPCAELGRFQTKPPDDNPRPGTARPPDSPAEWRFVGRIIFGPTCVFGSTGKVTSADIPAGSYSRLVALPTSVPVGGATGLQGCQSQRDWHGRAARGRNHCPVGGATGPQ